MKVLEKTIKTDHLKSMTIRNASNDGNGHGDM